jgi:hypothetical protein
MKALGKYEQSRRSKKLLTAHILLQDFIKSGMVQGNISQLWETLALPDTQIDKTLLTKEILKKCMIEQGAEDKKQLLTSQKDYLALMASKIKGLGLGAQRTELTRKALIEYTPISGVFTSQQKRYEAELLILKDKDLDKACQVYLDKELSGSAFNLNVFSMRTSHSRVLAKSKMVKDF